MTKTIRQRLARVKKWAQDQRGLGLVETLVSVAILGTSVVAFVAALSVGTIAVGEQDEEVVAQGLVRSQLEYTKSYTYNPDASTYPMIAVPAGYSLAVVVSSVPGTDTNIQKITVTASRDGEDILTVSDYKVNR
jgi:Tfp pilus assembly protein PilV